MRPLPVESAHQSRHVDRQRIVRLLQRSLRVLDPLAELVKLRRDQGVVDVEDLQPVVQSVGKLVSFVHQQVVGAVTETLRQGQQLGNLGVVVSTNAL